jgi:hypothetical protein
LRHLSNFDGSLAPRIESADTLYVAAYFRLDGIGYCGLSWWDRTVDQRGKCNSIYFSPFILAEPPTLLPWLRRDFPWVLDRLPRSLSLWIP